MRDKNLDFSKFNIQLRKICEKWKNQTFHQFFENHVLNTPTLSDEILPEIRVSYPKSFRLMRTLCILLWYFPKSSYWYILCDLKLMNFPHFNRKQRLELKILLSSKENMEKYLFETKRYTSYEIFGNILGNDARDLFKTLKVGYFRNKIPRRTIRRRGYQDHGSRKPDEKWLPQFDFSFTEYQNEKEKKQYLFTLTVQKVVRYLENLHFPEEDLKT